mmetsp:Transcript_226/g.522  ORF Transcript_226/g.522 Transcript_226/m.522 type:complete len:233 (+) Transcript_226:1258-1956(+)
MSGAPWPPLYATECTASMMRLVGLAASSLISAFKDAATLPTSCSANLGFITQSASSSTASGRLVRRQSTVYAICSRLAEASMLAPMTSASRVTRKDERLVVARNAMRSSRWLAPTVYGVSFLDPAAMYSPTASDAPWVSSDAILAPLARVVMWVLGAVVGASGASGMKSPFSGWSMGGIVLTAPPNSEARKDGAVDAGVAAVVASAGSPMADSEEVLTPRAATRRALDTGPI